MAAIQIPYEVTAAGIKPITAQPGGVQGDQNAVEIVFSLGSDIDLTAPADHSIKVRADVTDGAGGFYASEHLTIKNQEVHFLLPAEVTAAGGTAQIHLVFTLLNHNNNEEEIQYSFPARVYFESTGVGSLAQNAYKKGLSGLAAEAKASETAASGYALQAVQNAVEAAASAERAEEAAQSCTQPVEEVLEAAKAAAKSASEAEAAETSAAGAAYSAETHAGIAQTAAEQSAENAASALASKNAAAASAQEAANASDNATQKAANAAASAAQAQAAAEEAEQAAPENAIRRKSNILTSVPEIEIEPIDSGEAGDRYYTGFQMTNNAVYTVNYKTAVTRAGQLTAATEAGTYYISVILQEYNISEQTEPPASIISTTFYPLFGDGKYVSTHKIEATSSVTGIKFDSNSFAPLLTESDLLAYYDQLAADYDSHRKDPDAHHSGAQLKALDQRSGSLLIAEKSGSPIFLPDMAFPNSLLSLTLTGVSSQDGTPTPETPIWPHYSNTAQVIFTVGETSGSLIEIFSLYGLPGGIGDIFTFDYITRKSTYQQNVDMITLNGTESWSLRTDVNPEGYKVFRLDDAAFQFASTAGLCEKLPVDQDETGAFEHVRLADAGDYVSVQITIKTDRLATADAAGFKAWLAENPLHLFVHTPKEATPAYAYLSELPEGRNMTISVNELGEPDAAPPVLTVQYGQDTAAAFAAHNEDPEAHEELRESMHDVLVNYAAPAVIRTFGPAKSGVISNAVPGARLRALSALGETTLSAEPSPETPVTFSSVETISGSINSQTFGPISTPLRAVPAASGWTARDSIDLLSGSLSRRIAVRTFTGNEAWTKYNVGSSDVSTSCFTCTLTDKAVGWGTSICSHFRNTRGTHPFSPSRMTHGIYCDHNQVRNIYVDWGEGPDVTAEAFKAWLAEQNAAGTPVTLYYVLEAPATEPVQAQSFVLESGTAAVTATAELRIDYLMDTGAALEELTNAVLAMGGELNV